MHQYLNALSDVISRGEMRQDRTAVGAASVFGLRMEFNLKHGFPLVTTKAIHWKSVVHELLWFIAGDTNTDYLNRNGVRIWNEWADENGDLGRVYGAQWRSWQAPNGAIIDQLKNVIEKLRANPTDRRHLIVAWNPGELDQMALPPCHVLFQFFIDSEGLSCQLYQRSADMFLGVPFNIASYSLLTHMIAHDLGIPASRFIWVGGDCHIYRNHFQQVRQQLIRPSLKLPTIKLNPDVRSVFDMRLEDIELIDYNPHPAIKGEVAV